jgi:hypothetical protein
MDNFNLQKFLKEGRITKSSTLLTESSDPKIDKLKEAIRQEIASILTEADEDIDAEVEDILNDEAPEEEEEVDIEPDAETIDDTEVSEIQDLLNQVQEKAESLNDEKFLKQIGNTITYFTRAHVVKAEN